MQPIWVLETLVVAYAHAGSQDKLESAMPQLFDLWPQISLRYYRNRMQHYRPRQTIDHWIEGLRLAGVPEWPQGIVARPERLLTTAEFQAMSSTGVQRVGTTSGGGRFVSMNDDDGNIRISWRNAGGYEFMFERKQSRLILSEDGNTVREACYIEPQRNLGREWCSLVLRNPEGKQKDRNIYQIVTDRSVSKFAVFPREQEIDWTKP